MALISELAKKYGAAKLRFFMLAYPSGGVNSSLTSPELVECVADEVSGGDLTVGGRLVLVPIDRRFAIGEFSTSEFETMMERHPDEYRVVVV